MAPTKGSKKAIKKAAPSDKKKAPVRAKRKLDKSATTKSGPVTPKRSRVPGGILKEEGTPSSGHKRNVTFPPPPELEDTLNGIFKNDGKEIGEDDLPSLLASVESLRGPSLIMWLQELQVTSEGTVSIIATNHPTQEFSISSPFSPHTGTCHR